MLVSDAQPICCFERNTHRLDLTLILAGMERNKTPRPVGRKSQELCKAYKHTQMKAATQPLTQHIRRQRGLKPQARIQVDSWSEETLNKHADLMIYTTNAHSWAENTPHLHRHNQ